VPHVDRDLFRRLVRARAMLRADGSRPLEIRSVAERVLVSRFHFARRFEGLFGVTPKRYRSEVRLREARRLLARGELSVTEVCFAVGFESLGTFSSLFRRSTGLSPSEYRRSIGPHRPPEPGCLTLMGRIGAGELRTSEEA